MTAPWDYSTNVTSSGIPLPPFAAAGTARDPVDPGVFPFTRGIAADLYRDQHWVMGMYSGYSSPKETNERIRRLLATGQRGFSLALDLPTQIGLDSDDPLASGEVGRVGVPIDTLADMEALLDGIPLHEVAQARTTANAIGPIAIALFLAVAEKQQVDPGSMRVLLQNDVLKEYVARGTQIFPPAAGLRFSVDAVEYCARHLPTWEPIEFCGYHIRDSGASAVQELGVALANATEYLDEVAARGVDVAALAPHLFMFLSAGLDLFEEVAKFRAARRMWACLLHERYGVEESRCGLRIFSYTLGSPLTRAEPTNNIIRVAYEALVAALGGAQTLATSSYDEALGLPSDEAVHLALRTQQILAAETGVRRSTDPLGGSYLVEGLTDQIERLVDGYLGSIADQGGALAALESGWLANDLSASAYRMHREVEAGERSVVGVNKWVVEDAAVPVVRAQGLRAEAEAEQVERLAAVRAGRDAAAVDTALAALRKAAAGTDNTVPYVLDAIRAYASIGEIVGALAEVWGRAEATTWHLS